MTAEELTKEITEIVARVLETPAEEIDPDADFVNDLGMDSLGALEILASIEKRFKKVIPEEQLPSIRTINRTIALAKELLKIK